MLPTIRPELAAALRSALALPALLVE